MLDISVVEVTTSAEIASVIVDQMGALAYAKRAEAAASDVADLAWGVKLTFQELAGVAVPSGTNRIDTIWCTDVSSLPAGVTIAVA